MTAEPSAPADGTGSQPGSRLRASDADRTATVDLLQDAVARGLLTHDEGGERMAAALAARFRDELPPLTADLPPAPAPAPAGPTARGWGVLGSTLVAQVRHDLRAAAAAGPRSRRFWATALAAVLLVGFLVTIAALAVHGMVDGGDHWYGGDSGEHFHRFDHD
jgi:Domain of unknown function (DUF1707)